MKGLSLPALFVTLPCVYGFCSIVELSSQPNGPGLVPASSSRLGRVLR